MSFNTEQESFWAGEFGDKYVDRSRDMTSVPRRIAVFSEILSHTTGVQSILEFGSNVGLNLLSLRQLLPQCKISAIEINAKAIEALEQIANLNLFKGSILDFQPTDLGQHDFTFTNGVLIHIHPEKLSEVYAKLYECSTKYIMIKEYYNPTPVEIDYRGHSDRLFKRDFAGEMLDKYTDLELVDYGFQYHRDNNFPMDDSTWFLLKKS